MALAMPEPPPVTSAILAWTRPALTVSSSTGSDIVIRSGLVPGTLLLLQLGDCSLPIFELSESDRSVDAEILQ